MIVRTLLTIGLLDLLTPGGTAMAEPPAVIEGTWSGVLELPSGDLHVVLKARMTASGLEIEAFSPDQVKTGLIADKAQYDKGVFSYALSRLDGRYEGHWDEARQAFSGTWTQHGQALPLALSKGPPKPIERPQTPQPPFPYKAEDVVFANAAAPGVSLAGTLTLPEGTGPFPAAILISGSGPNDRDETLFHHKPFAVIADALTRRGIAVLRFDKRGIGGSKGAYASATTLDFASDAAAAVAYLRSRPEIDAGRIGLIGHSEGGLIAPLVAADDARLAFLVLLAGSGVRGDELLVAQNRALGQAGGMSTPALLIAEAFNRKIYATIMGEADDAKLKAALGLELTLAGVPAAARDAQIAGMVSPWLRSFLALDPAPTLAKLRLPVLALVGSKDLQVPADVNFPALKAALAQDPQARVEVVPDANHLFQAATTGLPAEYGRITQTMSPQALTEIGDFVLAHSKP